MHRKSPLLLFSSALAGAVATLVVLVVTTNTWWLSSSWPSQAYYVLLKETPPNIALCEGWASTGVRRVLVGVPDPNTGRYPRCMFQLYGEFDGGTFRLYRRPLNPLHLDQWAHAHVSSPVPLDRFEGYCRADEMFAAPADQSEPCRRLRDVQAALVRQTMEHLTDSGPADPVQR